MKIEYFDTLETKIDELLASYEAVVKRNAELMEIIAKKDQEIARYQSQIAEMTQERETVSRRIGALLQKLETLKTI